MTEEHYASANVESLNIKPPSCLTFIPGANKPWLLKMSVENGIELNREDYPDALPDDFAKEFMEILEKVTSIRFEMNND